MNLFSIHVINIDIHYPIHTAISSSAHILMVNAMIFTLPSLFQLSHNYINRLIKKKMKRKISLMCQSTLHCKSSKILELFWGVHRFFFMIKYSQLPCAIVCFLSILLWLLSFISIFRGFEASEVIAPFSQHESINTSNHNWKPLAWHLTKRIVSSL